jgi:two-component system, NarL family, response regulator LiaR
MRVLICDDAPDHRAFIRYALADAPELEIAGEAPDGATCLAAIALTHPDILVLDLHMPGLDGYGVLDALRERPDPPRVLVLSSEAEAAERVRAYGVEFLAKGVSPDVLRETLLELSP